MRLFTPTVFALAVTACSSGPTPRPDTTTDEASAILDAPIAARDRPTAGAQRVETMMILPETPKKPSRAIDGADDDWETGKFRRFETRAAIEKGEEFWGGNRDASFRVGVDADEGFLYFLVQVKDDAIVEAPMGEDPTDGVIIWLRDPGLDAIGKALPKNVDLDEYVDAETAIVIHPSGRVETWSDDELDFNAIMFHEVSRADNGYVVEVALKLEAFGEISSIPLPEVAFRVELLDGDEEDRPGWQTRLSTLPDDGSDSPRYATYGVGGLLPHIPVGSPPPRTNAIGRWRSEGGKWSFVSFEVVPKLWLSLSDMSAFGDALRETDALEEVCAKSRKDVELIEAYESRGGGFRTGLVMCGHRASKSGCSKRAQSNVFLVNLERDEEDDAWRLTQAIDIFEKPLEQCTHERLPGTDFYSHLALYPLDVLSSTVWVVGWTRTVKDRGLDREEFGITLLNSKYDAPHLGYAVTRMRESTHEERTLAESSVYLTYVDDDDNVDICQVEHLVEQACDGIDRGCRTYERGKQVLTHIQMWSPKSLRFEPYLQTKHPGCTAFYDFSDAEGYLVLQVKNRVGLLPSPRTNDGTGDDDKLNLF